ncbi:MAG: ORF6N domain-containing protein [Nitrospirota bacterium]
MTQKSGRYAVQGIDSVIIPVRGHKVILDRDLAALYGVATLRLNEAVKRNRKRFPHDFVFQLTRQELTDLISQFAISSPGHGGVRKLPWAFTEHGAVMAATILRSERAIQTSVFVVRAFVKMRAMLSAQKDSAGKLAVVEKTLTERLDLHERVISDVIQQIMSLLSPPREPEPEAPRPRIGFRVREKTPRYGVRATP